MSRGLWRQAGLLVLSLMGLFGQPVSAQTAASYQIRGPGATVLWGIEQGGVGTEIVVLAFSDLAPPQGDKPLPGPRVLFSVTRLTTVGNTLIRRQWYGDAALKARAFVISPGLTEAKLEAKVTGTLEEVRSSGEVTRREVKGTLKIRWVATGGTANTSLAINRQAIPLSVQLNAVGEGRMGEATMTVKVAGLGGRIQKVAPGSLLSPSVGTLSLTRQ